MKTGRPVNISGLNRRDNSLYRTWAEMKQRCYNPKRQNYKYYGGKGIIVCNEWKDSFDSFYTWAINNNYKAGLTLERDNTNGNYEPLNCRWATWEEQQLTKGSSIIALIDGKHYTLSGLAREFECSRLLVKEILRLNNNTPMRINGTKYETIDKLPAAAQPVSQFASSKNTAVGYIYIKYERYLSGKGSNPGYSIKCFKGSNFIIPD